jgi:trk system potassium uptake protein TrkA
LKEKYKVMVISVEETLPNRTKLIPRSNHIIKESDVLVLIGRNEDLDELKKLNIS